MNNFDAITELIKSAPSNYQEAKEVSEKIDQLLGININQIEKNLVSSTSENTTWNHLDPQIFQTPYTELREMIAQFEKHSELTWVDLGAAYGRMGFVLHAIRPNDQFVGFECVKERVEEGNRIYLNYAIKKSNLLHQDLQSEHFKIPVANIYFIYDYGKKEHVYKTLHQLANLAKNNPIQVFARGLGVRHYIMNDFPWLHMINSPIHTEHWSLFSS